MRAEKAARFIKGGRSKAGLTNRLTWKERFQTMEGKAAPGSPDNAIGRTDRTIKSLPAYADERKASEVCRHVAKSVPMEKDSMDRLEAMSTFLAVVVLGTLVAKSLSQSRNSKIKEGAQL